MQNILRHPATTVSVQHLRIMFAFVTFAQVLAASSTVYRVVRRYRIRRVWWDEYFVILATCGDLASYTFTCVWISVDASSNTRATLLKCVCLLYLIAVWPARISIALSITRIFPPGSRKRRIGIFLATTIGIYNLVVFFGTLFLCSYTGEAQMFAPSIQCPPGSLVMGLIGEIAADLSLIFFPFVMLRRISLSQAQKRLILGVLPASALISLTSSSGCAIVQESVEISAMMGHLQAAISLLVCNLLVIVSAVYRRLRRGVEDSDESSIISGEGNDTLSSTNVSGPVGRSGGTWRSQTFLTFTTIADHNVSSTATHTSSRDATSTKSSAEMSVVTF